MDIKSLENTLLTKYYLIFQFIEQSLRRRIKIIASNGLDSNHLKQIVEMSQNFDFT
jgi:hypothetical protein